jgi:hypothetical protein
MHLRTEIQAARFPFQLHPQQAVINLGSCFSENMANKLQRYGFNVAENPFGTSYNPMSLAYQLEKLIHPDFYQSEDLHFNHNLWFSFEHYSLFSNPERDECLRNINLALGNAAAQMQNAGLLILTLGTAHAWQHKTSGKIVNNCHKIPADQFERVLLKPNQIIHSFLPILQHLEIQFPNLKVLFTVSPVRHWRDGATGNQRSKSILHVATHELVEQCGNAFYFPAYELLMDDLRDYRFYTDDLLHPSPTAVDYIWNNFMQSILDDETRQAIAQMEKLHKSLEHRPRWPQSESTKVLKEENLKKVAQFQKQWPKMNWNFFIESFSF